jgi:hypothetical protein
MSNRPGDQSPATPAAPDTPIQMLTPKTPERRNPMKRSATSAEIGSEDEPDWDTFTTAHIDALSAADARLSVRPPIGVRVRTPQMMLILC